MTLDLVHYWLHAKLAIKILETFFDTTITVTTFDEKKKLKDRSGSYREFQFVCEIFKCAFRKVSIVSFSSETLVMTSS